MALIVRRVGFGSPPAHALRATPARSVAILRSKTGVCFGLAIAGVARDKLLSGSTEGSLEIDDQSARFCERIMAHCAQLAKTRKNDWQ